MKPEARVFEITSPTKKISRNYNFNKFSEFKHISYLRRGMSGPVTYLVLPGVGVAIFLEFHLTKQGLPLVDSWSRGLD